MTEPEKKARLVACFGPIPIMQDEDGNQFIPMPKWVYRLRDWVKRNQTKGGTGGYWND